MAIRDLFDFDGTGSMRPDVYHSAEIYDRELSTVFGRSWLFLAHESQIKQPGDFVTALMGEDPVIVSRQRDGGIRALLNVCRHRGMRVCRQDLGNSNRFTCSYHGWSYDGSGALVDVPRESWAYHDRLDKDGWSLVRVPRIESYRGMVFGCWDAEAPTLISTLADALPLLDPLLDVYPNPQFVGPMKWRLVGNWKLAAEQFAGDSYHPGTSHASAMTALGLGGPDIEAPGNVQLASRMGHGGSLLDVSSLPHLGDRAPMLQKDANLQTSHMTVFPNLSAQGGGSFRVWQPKGPGEMEIWSWVVVDAGADEQTRRAAISRISLAFSTSGIFETDDSENWSEIQSVSRGFVARQAPLNYQMGLGLDGVGDERLPGYIGSTGRLINDIGARHFYARWAELMDGEPLAPQIPAAKQLASR